MPRKSITKEFSRHSAQASLRRVLIIPFVLQIVAVIVLIGWLSLENGQQAVNNVAAQLRSSIVGRIEQRLEDYLFTPQLITQLSIQEIRNQRLNIQEPEELIENIQSKMKLFDTVNHIKFGFTDKNFISLERFDQTSLRVSISRFENDYGFSTYNLSPVNPNFLEPEQLINTQSEFNLQTQPWYQGAVEAGKPVWSPIYTQFNTPRLAITYSVPIYDRQQKLLGVAGIDLPLSQIGEFLRNLVVSKSGTTFIIDRSGFLVASSVKERPFLMIDGQTSRLRATSSNVLAIANSTAFLLDRFQNLTRINQEQQLDFLLDGRRELIQISPLRAYPELDWLIVVVNPESDFMGQIDANRQSTIYLCLGAFILALITGWYTSERILRPIQSLSEAADALSKGEWNQAVDIHSQGELGVLARAFNRMALQLQDSFTALETKEAKARTIAELLQEAQRVAHVGSWERDMITQQVTWSEEVFRIFGLEPRSGSLSYQDFLAKIHPDDRQHVADILSRSNTAGQPHQIEYRLVRPDGSVRYVFSKGLYSYNDTGEIIRAFGIVMDVTDRKESELALQKSAIALQQKANQLEMTLEELQRTQTQLIQGEKMSALGQLVAGVAHEINNPVNFIYGNLTHARTYADNLLEILTIYQQEYSDPSLDLQGKIEDLDIDFVVIDLPKLLDSMQVGAERIREIVKSLRSFSRLDEAEMKSVDIHEGLDSTLMILQNRLKAKGNQPEIIVHKNYGDLPQVECYAGQLNQVFMNVLSNAIDAIETPPEDFSCPVPQIEIQTMLKDHKWIQVSIKDNGIGIKPELLNRLFDPFFTTKPVGQGTGLGLAISHSIVVEKHKGILDCKSTLGEGTEFIIAIPVKHHASLG